MHTFACELSLSILCSLSTLTLSLSLHSLTCALRVHWHLRPPCAPSRAACFLSFFWCSASYWERQHYVLFLCFCITTHYTHRQCTSVRMRVYVCAKLFGGDLLWFNLNCTKTQNFPNTHPLLLHWIMLLFFSQGSSVVG